MDGLAFDIHASRQSWTDSTDVRRLWVIVGFVALFVVGVGGLWVIVGLFDSFDRACGGAPTGPVGAPPQARLDLNPSQRDEKGVAVGWSCQDCREAWMPNAKPYRDVLVGVS